MATDSDIRPNPEATRVHPQEEKRQRLVPIKPLLDRHPTGYGVQEATMFHKPAARPLRMLGATVLAVTSLVFVGSPAEAHQNGNPAPNGASPWHYSESWAITGSYYGEGYHVDWSGSAHYNDYYATDWAIPGAGCGKRLYALYDGMTVTATGGYNNQVEMQKTINGARYRVRYLHLGQVTVGSGATVGTNTIVGYSGATGNASGCHLHLSVHRLNTASGWWESVPPQFCGRTYPHDHVTRWKGC